MNNKVICPDCDAIVHNPWAHENYCPFYAIEVLEGGQTPHEELRQARQRIDELEEQNRQLLKQINAVRQSCEELLEGHNFFGALLKGNK